MSTRPQITQYPVIVNGAMSGSITSHVSVIPKLSMVSYSYSWSGTTPVGVITVEVSNDYAQNSDGSVKTAGTWNALPLNLAGMPVSSVPLTGNTGNGFIDVDMQSGYAIRTVYTRTSGTGTLQAILNAKVS